MPVEWIDIHAHILPAVDDGAETPEQALEMARVAQADGVAQIIATPHYAVSPAALASSVIRQRTEQVNRAIGDAGLDVLVLPGAEVQIDPDMCRHVESGAIVTLADSRYLLLELPLGDYPLYTEEIIFRLQTMGLSIVLAHPERNLRVQDAPDLLIPLVERGVLMQVTAASITGLFGTRVRAAAEYLLRGNMVHVIASDAHGGDYRRPVLSDAVAAAAEIVGWGRAEAMVRDTPWAIVSNQIIELPPPEPDEGMAKGFWKRFPLKRVGSGS